jgi:UDP-galactopyranose mutase
MKYDYLVVGAGIFGATFARQMTNAGKSCLVIDQRDHVAGNAFTRDEGGINVHAYGPHVFHTNSDVVWKFVSGFATFNHFVNRVKTWAKGRLYSMPINLMTLYQVYGVSDPSAAAALMERLKTPEDDSNLEAWAISQVGKELYRLLIEGYTAKQWMKEPRDLPASIIKRLPIRLTFDDNYYDHRYQGIPVGGYTKMVANMLNGVAVELGTGFMRNWHDYANKLVYTGKIDEYFDYCYGELDYRTCEFSHERLDQPDFQGQAQINYADKEIAYTRVIEHKHFEFGKQPHTIITKEYPVAWEPGRLPLYPVNDGKNQLAFSKYRRLMQYEPTVIAGGRLAEYRYMDMDGVIASALLKAREELARG